MKRFVVVTVMLVSIALMSCASGAERQEIHTAPDQESGQAMASSGNSRSDAAGFGESAVTGPAGAPGPAAPSMPGAMAEESMEPMAIATPAPAPGMAPMEDGDQSGGSSIPQQLDQRQVISTASVSIEVETVAASVSEIRTIVEGLGGFVEQLSSSGGAQREQAHVTVRVPQPQFFPALERIEALGEVQNRNVGSEDVSEEFIDLEARLASSQREEESLLSLLERTSSVTEILTVERELSRVRSEIERIQGRLNFLERRVALATISISLFTPQEEVPQPPAASLVIVTSDVAEQVNQIKGLVDNLEGELDRVFLSTREGRDRADLTLRVFTKDFTQTTEFIESRGDVRSKELSEGSPAPDGSTPSEEPDARVEISLVEEQSSNAWVVLAVVIPIVGVLAAIAIGVGIWLAYRAGRRHDRFVPVQS